MTTTSSIADVSVMSWNAKHLGRPNQDLHAATMLLAGAEIVAIQEVNSTKSGVEALARLADLLGHAEGARYCIGLSEIPTDAKERYGILWKEGAVSYVTTKGEVIGKCPSVAITLRLGAAGADEIIREPAIGVFLDADTGRKFHLATIHLVPTTKKPELEVTPLFETVVGLPGKYPRIVVGDFNLASDHAAFSSARKAGWKPALAGSVKTSLKSKGNGGFSKAYDNIFVLGAELIDASVVDPYAKLKGLDAAAIYNGVSDHAPVRATLKLP